MNIQETNTNNPTLIDLNSINLPKKSRGRPKKVKNVTETIIEPDAPKLSEKEKLKEELLRLSDYNDDIVTKPINDKLGKLIDEMDLSELRARIRQGRKITSKKMDTSVASSVILMAVAEVDQKNTAIRAKMVDLLFTLKFITILFGVSYKVTSN